MTHSAKHWSNETIMLHYIDQIVVHVPYVEKLRDMLMEGKLALFIMDNLKGQITPAVLSCLDKHNIIPCLLPPNTTDSTGYNLS